MRGAAHGAAFLPRPSNGTLGMEKNGVKVNAKSIMGLLTLEGHHGSKLRILASGADATDALQALAELFEQKFFED